MGAAAAAVDLAEPAPEQAGAGAGPVRELLQLTGDGGQAEAARTALAR
jgi:hypothetical protein